MALTVGIRAAAPVSAARASAARVAYERLPLAFESNRGQTDSRVKFLARGAGYTLFLTRRESVLSLREPASHAKAPNAVAGRGGRSAPAPASFATVRMRLAGANPRPRLVGLGGLPGATNYLTGRDPKAWHTHVPSYASVLSRDVYPRVDLLYHGHQAQLEYDFRVEPGGDPRRITLAFSGARALWLDQAGNLVLNTAAGVLRQDSPLVYQQLGGHRHPVFGRFVLRSGHRVSFRLGSYDRSRPLVIDPALVYSTYLGGAKGGNFGDVVAADSSGAAYVAGSTGAVDFPITSGASQKTRGGDPLNAYEADAFVTKLTPTGDALVYSTFLGGAFQDSASAIAVDSSGRAYVTGNTGSSDFPTTAGAFAETPPSGCNPYQCSAFLSVLKADGSELDYSTYLGGAGSNRAGGVAVDSSGNAYLTGFTTASDFPTKAPAPATPLQTAPGDSSGAGDAYVTKIDPTASGAASLVYSTYLGGNNVDAGNAIAVDAAGNAYVGGTTASTDLPTKNQFEGSTGGIAAGNTAGFVAKLNPAGSTLAYLTYLGGSTNDAISAIAVDPTGHAYVTGNTRSTDFPTKNAFQPTHAGNPSVDFNNDAFVTKLDPGTSGASSLVYSSYLGGRADDYGTAIAVTPSGTAYVAGNADTNGGAYTPGSFPTMDPIAPYATGGDAFISAIKPDGSGLSFSTYVGGGGEDDIGGLALDGAGNVYVAGNTYSTDLPITGNAYQPRTLSGGVPDLRETFVAKLVPVDPAAPLVTGLAHRSGPPGISLVITGHGFTGASAVRFGAAAASTFTVDSDVQITATVPSGSPGAVGVTVETPNGTSPPNPIATFTYAQGTWDLTGSLRVARRQGGTATLLGDGRVLFAGGQDPVNSPLAAAELYDPTTAKWTTTESMSTGRTEFSATLLQDGRVLVAGGLDPSFQRLASAELYDPAAGTWSPTGSLATARADHTATLLGDGKVLVAGGSDNSYQPLASAELYDPATGAWSPAGSLADARSRHTATLLSNGKVLVIGGNGTADPLSSAELYDPATNSWATTGPLSAARVDHTATRLSDGRVLVTAGSGGPQGSLNSAEIYDPVAGEFSPTAAMVDPRSGPAAALLSDGRVLVVGGVQNGSEEHTAELYDPSNGRWASAGVMNRYRGFGNLGHTVFALPLAGGNVLVAGDSLSAGATTELYNPAGPASPPPGPGPGPGPGPTATPPAVTNYGLTNNPFVVAPARTPIVGSTAATNRKQGKRHKKGTTFKYTLSEAATVKIVISQRVPGRRRGKSCVARSSRLRHAKRCVRIIAKGTLTRSSHVGANKVAFSGRIGSKALTPGIYQATLTATDTAKLASKPQTIYFTIVKR